MTIKVILRGGGDLASGVALRLVRIGIQVLICELANPYAVRRSVSYAEAIYTGAVQIEGTRCIRIDSPGQIQTVLIENAIPIMVDSELSVVEFFQPDVIIDGRMTKAPGDIHLTNSPFLVGLGPGFCCGINCHAAVETRRGPNLGRVVYEGCTEEDTGEPETVAGHGRERVLRAPTAGIFHPLAEIGDCVAAGQAIGEVGNQIIRAKFDGMIRGILQDGLKVTRGLKVGDLDPRIDPSLIHKVSDKALSVGGGVVEAILSRPEFRKLL